MSVIYYIFYIYYISAVIRFQDVFGSLTTPLLCVASHFSWSIRKHSNGELSVREEKAVSLFNKIPTWHLTNIPTGISSFKEQGTQKCLFFFFVTNLSEKKDFSLHLLFIVMTIRTMQRCLIFWKELELLMTLNYAPLMFLKKKKSSNYV